LDKQETSPTFPALHEFSIAMVSAEHEKPEICKSIFVDADRYNLFC
jgi:hypothetical protein